MYSQTKYTQGSPSQYSQYGLNQSEQMDTDQLNLSVQDDDHQINSILKNLKNKYIQLDNLIQNKEEEKVQIIDDMNVLSQRLNALTKSSLRKRSAYDNYDKTLRDAESAFTKITESTKTLLTVVKKEVQHINKVVK